VVTFQLSTTTANWLLYIGKYSSNCYFIKSKVDH